MESRRYYRFSGNSKDKCWLLFDQGAFEAESNLTLITGLLEDTLSIVHEAAIERIIGK